MNVRETRGIHVLTVGENLGTARIWLKNLSLLDADFQLGTPVTVEYGRTTISIRRADTDFGAMHVSARNRNGRQTPILDLNSELITRYFEIKEKVRVEIRHGDGDVLVCDDAGDESWCSSEQLEEVAPVVNVTTLSRTTFPIS